MSTGTSPWYVVVDPDWTPSLGPDGKCGTLGVYDTRKHAEAAAPKGCEIRTMTPDPIAGGGSGGGGGSILHVLGDPL
jgi:hypothetical protein